MDSGFNIIVTGHMGFVGQHLIARLAHPSRIVGLDIKEGNDILRCALPEASRVFHLAAQTSATYTDAMHDAETNILGTVRLAQHYRDRLVYASSSMVNYPQTPYAISKRAGEDYVRMYGGAIVRFCNLYGPGGHSLIDRVHDDMRRDHAPVIYGSGDQVRTYAHVDTAVKALLNVLPGEKLILPGITATVKQMVALLSPNRAPQLINGHPLDIGYAPQV